MSFTNKSAGLTFLEKFQLVEAKFFTRFSSTYGDTAMKEIIEDSYTRAEKDPIAYMKALHVVINTVNKKIEDPKCPPSMEKIQSAALTALEDLSYVLEKKSFKAEAVIASGDVYRMQQCYKLTHS